MAIQPGRVRALNDAAPAAPAAYVLYWMQQSQRAVFNPALELAVEEANARNLPVLVCFGLTDGYPEANARHYSFLLEGLAEVERALAARGIAFALRRGPPDEVALSFAGDAALLVCDRGYLKPQREWRLSVAARAPCRVLQVEGDVVVPVEAASHKHEIAARTLRPRIGRLLDEYLAPLDERPVACPAASLGMRSDIDLSDIPRALSRLTIDHSVPPVRRFAGGASAGLERFEAFLETFLPAYAKNRGVPEAGAGSHMSPYLHFGQVSPVDLALRIRAAGHADAADRATYLEELIVRRELAMNHCFYEPAYDDYAAMPGWAKKTLDAHRADPRPHLYTREQLEAGETHDRYWNAAMKEMRDTGYMHNHMRMYWGKKILEWSPAPEAAFDVLLRINNKYFVDGRDANSFTNVGWIFGLHDRPWGPRPVFGNVRSMSERGLKKFDVEGYVRAVDRLAAAERE